MTEVAEKPVVERLLRGAAHMGRLWLSKKVVAGCGWTLGCQCASITEWCKAKVLWVRLAIEDERVTSETGNGPFGIIELMSTEEIVASKLTVTFDLPDLGKLALGPKGQIPWETFFALVKDKDGKSFETVLSVLRGFPGAKVVK